MVEATNMLSMPTEVFLKQQLSEDTGEEVFYSKQFVQ